MNRLTNIVSPRNLPDFVREEYPIFVKLVEEYYKFLDEETHSGNIDSVKDIDNTEDAFLEYFKRQYAINLVDFQNLDFRRFLPFAKNFYTSRGTEDSLKFLFRALFGEEIHVDYPGKYILRASAGKWNQEYHITVETLAGVDPVDNIELSFTNGFGDFIINPTRVEKIQGTNRSIVFFKKETNIRIVSGQQIFQKDRETNEDIFAGLVLESVSSLKIINPGKYWQRGAVILIPGSQKDTYARVTKVGPNGEVLTVEVLQFGYEHPLDQSITLSPFPNKPLGASIDYEKELISTSPLIFHHTLTISEFTEGLYDVAIGTSDQQDYFLSDYFDLGYFGKTVFNVNSGFINSNISGDDGSGITIEEWLESRALFALNSDLIVKDRGYYKTSESIISNKEIRLQDNNYYQIFSYVIETERELSEYRSAINLIHPAGTKFFADLLKTAYIEIDPEVYRVMSNDLIQIIDPIDLTEIFYKTITKSLEDSQEVNDVRPLFSLGKIFDDEIEPQEDIISKLVGKGLVDSQSVLDTSFLKDVSKELADSYSTVDGINKEIGKLLADSIDNSEVLVKSISKPLADSIDNSDSIDKNIGKVLSDSQLISEFLEKGVEKSISDSINNSEIVNKSIGKILSDSLDNTEDISRIVGKLIDDQFEFKIEDTFELSESSYLEFDYYDDSYYITTKTLEIY